MLGFVSLAEDNVLNIRTVNTNVFVTRDIGTIIRRRIVKTLTSARRIILALHKKTAGFALITILIT